MTRLKLGEIAHEYKGKAKESEMGVLPIVGLEHLSSGDIDLVGFSEGGESTFTKKFLPGHVLFGRRRAYQRKASLAEFPGICSGDITVIEADEGALEPRLLPFIIQNDSLFDFAVENSAGSLSPRVKWARLAEYELDLPTLEKQRELADILWAAQDVRRKYKQLLRASDDIVKSRFVEMFGTADSSVFDIAEIEHLCAAIVDCPHETPKYQGNLMHPAIRTSELPGTSINWETMKYVSQEEYKKRIRRLKPMPGDIVYAREGIYGTAAILPEGYEFCLGQRTMLFRPRADVCTAEYLLHALTSDGVKRQADALNFGSTVPHVNVRDAKRFRVPVPPIELQQKFAAFVAQVDKSEVALQQSLDELNATMAAILNEELGTRDV